MIWPYYETRMLAEIAKIVEHIPHRDLAIQWDVCTEIVRVMEDSQLSREYTSEELLRGVARVGEAVPSEAELGIHLCYGDLGHKHTVEPRDMGLLVTISNWLARGISDRLRGSTCRFREIGMTTHILQLCET